VRVAILDDYQGVALTSGPWERLEGIAETTVFSDHLAGDDAVVERLAPFEVVVAMRERTAFPRAVFDRLPNLRLLVTTGRRNAAIDLSAASDRGVVVCGTGALLSPTAELAWALILALTRNVCGEDRSIREGGWQHSIGPELTGRTLGLIGLGRLGGRMAAIAHGFGMRVLAWSENLTPERAAEVDVELVPRDELLQTSDIVSIHLVLSERTRGLIGRDELALMKPTAYLVNTSRGPIVDEAALLEALHGGRIAGAGLDVYDVEPLPAGHPLRSAPRTVLTPHIGYVTTGTYEVFYRDAVEDIVRWHAGEPVRVL
jgi:phosphoglycerate dehydrogenase-like enzyme